jgi:hypothetical protein
MQIGLLAVVVADRIAARLAVATGSIPPGARLLHCSELTGAAGCHADALTGSPLSRASARAVIAVHTPRSAVP